MHISVWEYKSTTSLVLNSGHFCSQLLELLLIYAFIFFGHGGSRLAPIDTNFSYLRRAISDWFTRFNSMGKFDPPYQHLHHESLLPVTHPFQIALPLFYEK